MTLEELVDIVLSDLGEDPASPKKWTRAEAVDAVNNAYRSISEATEWYEVTLPIPIPARRTYIDLRNFGHTILCVSHCFNTNTQRWLNPRGVMEHDDSYRFWEFQSGAPEDFFARGLNWLGIWPRQEGDYGFIRASFTAIPPALVEDQDRPGFLEELQQGLIDYAKYELKAMDHQVKTALMYFASYVEHEEKLRAWVNSRRDAAKMHVLGEL